MESLLMLLLLVIIFDNSGRGVVLWRTVASILLFVVGESLFRHAAKAVVELLLLHTQNDIC